MSIKGQVTHLIGAAAVLVGLSLGAVSIQAQQTSVVNVYSAGDTNITDWLQNTVIPAFEKAYPQYTVQFTNDRSTGSAPIVQRAMAALQTGDDPQAEVFDEDPRSFPDAQAAGLWYQPTVQDIPNIANIIDAAKISPDGAAYRGSQVLIAYNSDAIPENEVPHTFADLVTWINAHPGKFVYSRPDKGGSGGNFVARAVYEVSGKDPSIWKNPFDQKLVDQYYPKAIDLLKSINAGIYDDGSYPAGNNPVLELFANGEVDMISAWSDQAIQSLNNGVLPESTKLFQFSDLPMPGGYTDWSIPKNAKNLKGAQDWVNFMLTPEMQASVVQDIGGFPAISWDMLPAALKVQFNSVITTNVPTWPGGDYDSALVKAWYEQVATNLPADATPTPIPTAEATAAS